MREMKPGQYWAGQKRDGHGNRRSCRIVGTAGGKLAVQTCRESAGHFDKIKLVTESWMNKWIAEQQASSESYYCPVYTEEEVMEKL